MIYIYSTIQTASAHPSAAPRSQPNPTATPINAGAEEEVTRPNGWDEDSHGSKTAPNYAVVFPQDKVNQLTITITPASWAAMQANMVELMGQPGQGGGPGGPPGAPGENGNWFAQLWAQLSRWAWQGMAWAANGNNSPQRGGFPGGPPGDMGGGENPTWITATITFAGQEWTNVGVRYKGNSSLRSSWGSNSRKLPLKLDFDQFETEYPEIKNQRFYGFKQLALANGFGDATYMRDALTYDLLAQAGLPAAETAIYQVVLDYGEGPVTLGLYTVVEVIDDTVVERYFGNDNGNIYEGDGPAVTLAEGTLDRLKDSFQKENHQAEADWSDIEELYEVLHSNIRTVDPATWRAKLESVFEVDGFLKWLAISAAIQHWDTYGNMSHNFYLYHHPDTNRLTWISWDHNLVLGGSPGGGGGRGAPPSNPPDGGQPPQAAANGPERGGPPGGGGPGGVSLDKAEVGDNWPLIRYLLDDPVYHARYLNYLADAGKMLDDDGLIAKYQNLAALLRPYVDDPDAFDQAVQALFDRAKERSQTVADFLAAQNSASSNPQETD